MKKPQKTDIVDEGNKMCESKIVEEIKIDELFSYIKDKKTRIQKTIDKAVKAKFYYSDANPSYPKCILFRKTLLFSR